ncbi:unnamed protein product, partial [Ixodes hexagonus]
LVAGSVAALILLLAKDWSVSDRIRETPRSAKAGYCVTADCQKLAWLFHQAIDTQENPCDSFYHYVCGSVLRRYGPHRYSTVSEMGENLTVAFHTSLIEAEPPRRNQSAFYKAASFYQSCLRRSDAEDRNRAVLEKFLEANDLRFHGGRTFDSVRVLVQLLFGANINFLFRVELDRTISNNRYVLSLSTSPEFKSWMHVRGELIDHGDEYDEYITAVLAVIGFTQEPELHDTVTQIKTLEDTVINLTYGSTSDKKDYFLPLSELPTWFDMNHKESKLWSKRLSAYTLGRTPGDYKIRGPVRNFLLLRFLLKNTSSEQFRIYATWEVLRLLSNVSGLIKGQGSVESADWYCYKETRKLFAHAVALHTFFPVVNESRLVNINTMVDNIVGRLDQTIGRSEWLQGPSLRKTLDKLHRINLQLAYPGGLDTAEGLEEYYRGVPDVTGPYLDAYLKSSAATMRRLISFISQPTANPRNIEFETRKVNAYYFHSGEFALFPAAILVPPTFNYGAPPEINYGSLGRIISHEFMHALDRSWINSIRARSHSFFLSVDMEQAYLSKSQCLLSSTSRQPKGVRMPQSWMPEFLADHMGQSALIEAYRRLNTEPAPIIKALERFTGDQLFFISSCLFLCSSYKSGPPGSHPPSVDRCNVPLKHSPEFAKAFSCPSGSPMNPTNKCSFW